MDLNNKELNKLIDLYDTKEFSKYNYDGTLGVEYSKYKSTFRVWSPISTEIILKIYRTGTPKVFGGSDIAEEYPMTMNEYGVWEKTIFGDLEGYYYTYTVTNPIYTKKETTDPYAKSTGINGIRGMIVDFSKTNPEGFDMIKPHKCNISEMVVYETHIADLSNSPFWGGYKENRRLFEGAYQENTSYNGLSTGFDNIKELGVNYVQILPFFDQENDERPDDKRNDGTVRTFNWGYNPKNYNALDGIYSKNPYDGYEKIKEFKNLVLAYHKANINIIMDVVYNHVNDLQASCFDTIMPGYYFRYKDGKINDGSACGNETASEMYMYKKYMLDSTLFWASEYKLGGFRFDLMGVHNVETMNDLALNLHNYNPDIVVYGEPWAAGPIALKKGFTQAIQTALPKYKGYGCFNDKIRDALIKGGLNTNDKLGWVTDTKNIDEEDIIDLVNGLNGKILKDEENYDYTKCVNYATCHDNFTLYDRIKAAGVLDEDIIKKMAMLANSIVLTSRGISFMLAGEEFLRTKGGDDNSYISSYEVNELDYKLKSKNIDMYQNYKKLIALKKSGLFNNELDVKTNESSSLIYYKAVNNNEEYLIIHSNGVEADDKTLDLTGYKLYLDTLNSNILLTNKTQILPFQTLILKK